MLSAGQITQARRCARNVMLSLENIETISELFGGVSPQQEDEMRDEFKLLARIIGYRVEPITPHAVLKQELVESLSGRDEPSAELTAMRKKLK